MRRVRNDGASRRPLEKQRSGRWIVRAVIPVSLALARDEDANDDNKRSTNATYGAAILRLTQSHGPGIHAESNR